MEDEDDDEDNEDENEQRLYHTSKATTTATTTSTTSTTTTTYRARRVVSCLAIIGQQQDSTCSSRCDQMGARCPSHMRLASRQTDKQASRADDISQTRTTRRCFVGAAWLALLAQLTAKGKGKEGTSNSKGDGHNKVVGNGVVDADSKDPLLLAKTGRWKQYFADQTSESLLSEWSRITLVIIRRWENERACTASNIHHRLKWTRRLRERHEG